MTLLADDVLDTALRQRSRQSTQPLQQVALHVLEHETELLPLVEDLSQLHHVRVVGHRQQRLHFTFSHSIIERQEGALEVLDCDEAVGWIVTSGHDSAKGTIADDTLDTVVLHKEERSWDRTDRGEAHILRRWCSSLRFEESKKRPASGRLTSCAGVSRVAG